MLKAGVRVHGFAHFASPTVYIELEWRMIRHNGTLDEADRASYIEIFLVKNSYFGQKPQITNYRIIQTMSQ